MEKIEAVTAETLHHSKASDRPNVMPKRKRKIGDRPDGRKIRSLPPLNKVAPYIMPNRSGASVYFKDSFEITEVENYIRKKRKQGLKGFGIMHVLLAAYIRVVSQRPAVNRFLSGQKLYQRDDDIVVMLTIKRSMTLEAEETIVKAHFRPTDTADDVYALLNRLIMDNRPEDSGSDFDGAAKILNYIPGIFLKFAVWFLKTLDYFGLLGKGLLEVSPFHGSFYVTSMGSLGIPPVYHHLYDFGNVPVFMSFGAKRKETERKADGTEVVRKYVDYTVVCDERICDGFYYASAFKLLKTLLRNPHELDVPPETVVRDVD